MQGGHSNCHSRLSTQAPLAKKIAGGSRDPRNLHDLGLKSNNGCLWESKKFRCSPWPVAELRQHNNRTQATSSPDTQQVKLLDMFTDKYDSWNTSCQGSRELSDWVKFVIEFQLGTPTYNDKLETGHSVDSANSKSIILLLCKKSATPSQWMLVHSSNNNLQGSILLTHISYST